MYVQSQRVYGICLTILCERFFKLRNNRGYNTQPRARGPVPEDLSEPEDPPQEGYNPVTYPLPPPRLNNHG